MNLLQLALDDDIFTHLFNRKTHTISGTCSLFRVLKRCSVLSASVYHKAPLTAAMQLTSMTATVNSEIGGKGGKEEE